MVAKGTVFAINGVNPSTDLDVVRAHIRAARWVTKAYFCL